MNDKLISKSFNSMMIMMIFAGVVAMCGSVIDGVIIGNCLSADSMTAFGYASPVFIFLAAIGGVLSNGGKAQCAILTGKGLYEEARENFSRIFLLTSCAGEMAVSACSVRNTIGNFVDAIFMGVVGTISIFSGMFYGERNKNALRSTFRTACKYAMFLAFGCG